MEKPREFKIVLILDILLLFSKRMRINLVSIFQLPKYITLCIDEVWGVRKACVDVMLSVASCVTIYEYRMILSKLLADQLKDESKWVRTSAYQILGPFISIFATQFTGLRYNQFGDFVMSHNQGSELRQNM